MHLYLQCPTGISGDMFLGAMADLGLDLLPLAEMLSQAGLEVNIHSSSQSRCGLQGTKVEVVPGQSAQPLRTMEHIRPLIQATAFSSAVKTKAEQAFERLARVEAEVHNMPLSQVHFHEVGGVDTLTDILGSFWAVEALDVTEVTCSTLPWFQGQVECTHGQLHLPAPATERLLQGKPFVSTSFEGELITPTGALIVDQMAARVGVSPRGTLIRSGTGWGDMDLGSTPNGLRAFLFEDSGEISSGDVERVVLLESNVDHLSGEEIGGVYGPLFASGALDIIYLPGVMKKNRPGGLLQVMCRPGDINRVQACFVEQTMTLGLRRREMERVILPRQTQSKDTPWGQVAAKTTSWQGEEWSRPEFEALQDLARKTGRSVVQLRYLLQGLQDDGEA